MRPWAICSSFLICKMGMIVLLYYLFIRRKWFNSCKPLEQYFSTLYMLAVPCSVASGVSDSATPWTTAHQAPLSMEFSRQGYWGSFPFPIPGCLPDPGTKSVSLVSPALAGGFFTTWATWEAHLGYHIGFNCHVHLAPPICDRSLVFPY